MHVVTITGITEAMVLECTKDEEAEYRGECIGSPGDCTYQEIDVALPELGELTV